MRPSCSPMTDSVASKNCRSLDQFTCTQKNVPDTMNWAVSQKKFAETHARLKLMAGVVASSHKNMLLMEHSRPQSRACLRTVKSIICKCTARLPAASHFASDEHRERRRPEKSEVTAAEWRSASLPNRKCARRFMN